MQAFPQEQIVERAFLRVAGVMKEMLEEKGASDTRLLLPPLVPDPYVIVGESVAGREHKEHVVPRRVICLYAHEMLREGASCASVALLLRKLLKIVYVTREEQQRLDSGRGLNLRQRMPKGWAPENGNVYARLEAARIRIQFYENAPGLQV